MAEISAKQVQALREKTGLAMMDVKKALVEAGGDEKKALELLRKRFADKMTERADKEAGNGRIGVYADDKAAAMAELRCETDFVATNDTFKKLADTVAAQVARTGETDIEKLKATKLPDGRTVNELMVDAFGTIKENISIRRAARLAGPGACYVHHNGKVATILTADKNPGDSGRNICMHIASTPVIMGLNRENVDPKLVAEAKEKATEESKGKPANILDKIVAGKMDRWYGERVLTEQPFVMDDKKTVAAFAKENGYALTSYLKYEVGGLD